MFESLGPIFDLIAGSFFVSGFFLGFLFAWISRKGDIAYLRKKIDIKDTRIEELQNRIMETANKKEQQ